MPTKGFFTQGVAVLFGRQITLDDIESFLTAFKIVKRKDEFEHWEFGGPSFTIEFRPEVNGYIAVDIVNGTWPDKMGDPKTEATLFGAWGMGHFGPFTFPGSLERALQHCYGWKQGPGIVAKHQSLVRIRSSYVFGTNENAPVLPNDYKPVDELNFIIRIVMDLLRHPDALCYFNPNGELLAERPFMQHVLDHYQKEKLPPVDLWSNRRMYKLNENWMLMDTVGMQQVDLDDIEACFCTDRFNPNDISLFLGNTSLYLAGAGPVIKDGETIDGPNGVMFRAQLFDEAMVTPPRKTLRFRPEDGTKPPPEFGFTIAEKKKGWQFWK
jgi:hypothetical protein